MNWVVKSEKNKRTYDLELSTSQQGNELRVEITVPKKNPRGVYPIGWHESEIRKMLKDKGYDIDECLNSTYITNNVANTKIFMYTVKIKSTPKRSSAPRKAKTTTNNTRRTRTTAKVESTDP